MCRLAAPPPASTRSEVCSPALGGGGAVTVPATRCRETGPGNRDKEDLMGRDRRQRRRRAVAVAGAGVAAKKHHDAKQAEQQEAAAAQSPTPAEPSPAVAPAAGGALTPEAMEQLKQLGDLHEQDLLTDEEFEREKAKVLGTG